MSEKTLRKGGERETKTNMNVKTKQINVLLTVFSVLICFLCGRTTGVNGSVDFLFVQTGTGVTLNGTLSITGVAKDTLYFSDRPVRTAGHMSTEDFLTLFDPLGTFSEVRQLPLSLSLSQHVCFIVYFELRSCEVCI